MSLLLRGIAVFALACLSPMAMASEAELTALMRQLESMECQAEHDADSADRRTVDLLWLVRQRRIVAGHPFSLADQQHSDGADPDDYRHCSRRVYRRQSLAAAQAR